MRLALGREWEYSLRAYRGGLVIMETVHNGQGSIHVQLCTWMGRMKRGEVSHLEVVYHGKPFQIETIFEPMDDMHVAEFVRGIRFGRKTP